MKGPHPAPVVGGAALEISGLCTGYRFDVLHDVDLEVRSGEVVTLLGANGAGKSTLAKAIMGLIPTRAGTITLDGEPLSGCSTDSICARRVALVPEGRRIFARRTVEDNLLVAGWAQRHDRNALRMDVERLLQHYPILGARRKAHAGSLSGGEAQLLAIAMAMVVRPRLVIFDEPSLGLSPIAVQRIAEEVRQLGGSGTSVLLIEQNARMALNVAARGYVLDRGRVALTGESNDLIADDGVHNAYLRV